MTLEAIKIKKLNDNATIPTRSHPTDAGLDLYALGDHVIEGGGTALVKTGIAVDIPEGYEGSVRPRSGLTLKTPLKVQLGTIDSGYQSDVGIIAHAVDTVVIREGDKIAQLVISPIENPVVNVVKDFDGETERGENGFGSTDNPKQRAKEAEQFFSGMHGGW